MKRKNFLIGFLLVGGLSMLIMSIPYFTQKEFGILEGKVFKDSLWYQLIFLTHVSFGAIAILFGPFQFMGGMKVKKARTHKRLGYIYCLAVACSSLSGLVIAQFSMGGNITRIGFSILAIVWFYSLVMALKKVLAGDINAHKEWMRINYAVTFAAITQRTLLLFAFFPYFSFMPIYQLSSWLPWILNLGIALMINKKSRQYAY